MCVSGGGTRNDARWALFYQPLFARRPVSVSDFFVQLQLFYELRLGGALFQELHPGAPTALLSVELTRFHEDTGHSSTGTLSVSSHPSTITDPSTSRQTHLYMRRIPTVPAHLNVGFQLDLELGVFLPVSREECLNLCLVLLLPLLLALHVGEFHFPSFLEQAVHFRLFTVATTAASTAVVVVVDIGGVVV